MRGHKKDFQKEEEEEEEKTETGPFLRGKCSYLGKQCAADRTQFSVIREPPQI